MRYNFVENAYGSHFLAESTNVSLSNKPQLAFKFLFVQLNKFDTNCLVFLLR